MKKIIVGIFLILPLIILGYIGLTDLELAKIVEPCYAGLMLIVVIVDLFITRGQE